MASNWRPQVFFISVLSCFTILARAEVITAQDIIDNIKNTPLYSEYNEITTTDIPPDEDIFQTTNTVTETSTFIPDTRRRSGKFELEYNYTPKEMSESFLDDEELFIPLGLHQSHPCRRTCVSGSPMTCRYNFTIEWYQTMSKACYDCPYNKKDCFRPDCVPADGMSRPITVVNRMMPGPSIEVCQGDKIIVDVTNALMVEGTTIHWHGHHQRGTPYMDGTPFITQCPIQSGSTFRYHFEAVHAGTHFWHSHAGMQRADGAAGAFIVRKPHETENHADLYNYDRSEHVMIVTDWVHELSLNTFTDHHHSTGRDANKPPALLINGLGRFRQFPKNQTNMAARSDKVETDEVFYMNTAKFVVEQGYKYRFRIINAEFLNCPIELSIDNHTLTIVSSDGYDIEPIEATSLVTYAGERFDFILDADQRAENYWIRFRGLMDCDERFTQAWQVAILHYDTALDIDPPGNVDSWHASHNEGLQVNALNSGTEDLETISIPQLTSLEPADITLKPEADLSYYISYDFYAKNNSHFHKEHLYGFHQVPDVNNRLYTPQLNHISMKLPATPFLLDRGGEQPSCDAVTGGVEGLVGGSRVKGVVKVQEGKGGEGVLQGAEGVDCRKQYCECSHVVNIPLGSVVELILVDEGVTFDANHPFHLHGHAFRVIAMERLSNVTTVEEIRAHDAAGRIRRNLVAPPYKDTVTVPDGGYTVIRWLADNPGYWLFHCHIEFHAEVGMSLVFKVGSRKDMAPLPYKFPSCGSWTPDEEVLKPNSTDTSGFWLWSWWPMEQYNSTSGSSVLVIDSRVLAYSVILCIFSAIHH